MKSPTGVAIRDQSNVKLAHFSTKIQDEDVQMQKRSENTNFDPRSKTIEVMALSRFETDHGMSHASLSNSETAMGIGARKQRAHGPTPKK